MNWYRVTREDGSYSYIQATSKSEASQKVRKAGEAIKVVKEIDASKVPAGTPGLATPAATPAAPAAEPAAKPAAKPATTPTTTRPMTPEDWAKAAEKHDIYKPIAPISEFTVEQQKEYDLWQDAAASGLYPNMFPVGSIEEYWETRDELRSYLEYYDNPTKASKEQWDSYQRFLGFSSKYGDLNDYSPKNFADYITNYDQAQQQLASWTQEAGPEATGFTDAQIREFNAYKQYYYQYGDPGEWVPVDVGDFITNYDQAQKQLQVWEGRATEAEQEEAEREEKAAEIEEHALSPEEQARRREEAYERGEEAYEHALSPEEAARRRAERYGREQVAAGEAYHETPRYSQMFSGWMGEQGEFSGALRGYIEKQYPSLRGQYEAGLPQETGYATPTEARAAAAEREAGYVGWLGEQVPEVYQQYMGQRPSERGERLYMQAPTTRTVNW